MASVCSSWQDLVYTAALNLPAAPRSHKLRPLCMPAYSWCRGADRRLLAHAYQSSTCLRYICLISFLLQGLLLACQPCALPLIASWSNVRGHPHFPACAQRRRRPGVGNNIVLFLDTSAIAEKNAAIGNPVLHYPGMLPASKPASKIDNSSIKLN